jgi:hypothetical protein
MAVTSAASSSAPDSVASFARLLQDRLVEFDIRRQTLEPPVLLLECFEPLGFALLDPAVLHLPAVVDLLTHAELLHDLRVLLARRLQGLRLAPLLDDFLG